MKHLIKPLLALMLSAPISVHGFEVDGIYYEPTSDNEVMVTHSNTFETYSGDVIIPESVTNEGTTYTVTAIGYSAFQYSDGLNSVTMPNTILTINDNAFAKCRNLMKVDIPNSVTKIGSSAFSECEKLTDVSIGNSVKTIGSDAFSNCNIMYIKIPNGVTSIGSGAFLGCVYLLGVSIPNSVTNIGNGAFSGCPNLTSIYCFILDPSRVTMGIDVFFNYSDYSSRSLFVPYGKIETYRADNRWGPYFTLIGELDENGDVNEDETLDVNDATAIISKVTGNMVTPFDERKADVNGDGQCDIDDVTIVISLILGA